MEYHFLMIAKGGGSANKTFLYQETKALLNPASLVKYLTEKMKTLGTAACPPYHLAFAIGGTSAEGTLKAVKLASAKALDGLRPKGASRPGVPRQSARGAAAGGGAEDRDRGAVRGEVLRPGCAGRPPAAPRASCPIGMGVSCSADRNILAKIDREGIWVEQLETNPGRFIPSACAARPTGPRRRSTSIGP